MTLVVGGFTVKTNKLHVGDTFHVESYQKDPFKQANVFGGAIINKKGPYIQYIDDYGDTCSTNIRDAYLFPKTFKMTVTNGHEMNR